MNSNNETDVLRMDFSLETPEERTELVSKIIEQTPSEKLTPDYLTKLSDYIIFATDKQDKKNKSKNHVLTDNHMVTVNRRETSFQGLSDSLENGEDGIYNMIAQDKNIIAYPKNPITQADKDSIPELAELCKAIESVEEQFKRATGRKKASLMIQLKELRQDQYIIRAAYQRPIYSMNLIKSSTKIDFSEHITIGEDGLPHSDGFLSFFDPKHISLLLCNYCKIKEDAWGCFSSDSYYMMEDLDVLSESALADYPIYQDIVLYKIDGKQNTEIQELLEQKHGIYHSIEYISSLWRNKIPKLIAEQAQEDYLIWYYTNKEKGTWKKCNRCGQIKLAHNKFFSKNKTSKDGYYSICKKCRNKKARA